MAEPGHPGENGNYFLNECGSDSSRWVFLSLFHRWTNRCEGSSGYSVLSKKSLWSRLRTLSDHSAFAHLPVALLLGSFCATTFCHAYNFVLSPWSKEKYPWEERSSYRKESVNKTKEFCWSLCHGRFLMGTLDTCVVSTDVRWIKHTLGLSPQII